MLDYNNAWLQWCLNAPIELVLVELGNKMDSPLLAQESEMWNVATEILPIVIVWIRDLYGMGIQPPSLHKWVGNLSAWKEATSTQDVSIHVQHQIHEFLNNHQNMTLDEQINFSVAGLIIADLLVNGNTHKYYGELLSSPSA